MLSDSLSRHLVFSDVHVPFHDEVVVDEALRFAASFRPGVVHLLGDIIDFYAISHFDREPDRALRLQEELDAAALFLQRIRDVCPDALLVYSEGNHERRLRRYLHGKAVELSGLRCLRLEELLAFDKLGIRYFPYNKPYCWGKLLYTHGHFCRKWSGSTARAHYERVGRCCIVGHVHRAGSFFSSSQEDTFGAWENPCMCRLDVDFVFSPDWQQGWSVVTYSGERFYVEQVVVINGQYVWRGALHGLARPRHGRVIADDLSHGFLPESSNR